MHLLKRTNEDGSVILQTRKAITILLLVFSLTSCSTLQWDNVDIYQVIQDIEKL